VRNTPREETGARIPQAGGLIISRLAAPSHRHPQQKAPRPENDTRARCFLSIVFVIVFAIHLSYDLIMLQ
jgi:hypothetical protein